MADQLAPHMNMTCPTYEHEFNPDACNGLPTRPTIMKMGFTPNQIALIIEISSIPLDLDLTLATRSANENELKFG